MRRLATALGVTAMTLYTYVRSKDELLDAVVDRVVSHELDLGGFAGSWRADLGELMRRIYAMLVANPFIVRVRLRRPLASPRQLQVNEAGVRILMQGGFDAREAARAYRSLLVVTFGFAAFGPPEDSRDQENAVRAALAGLSADDYPYLTRAAAETVETHAPGPALFEYTLERALEGLERAARGRGSGRP
jgi:AcrR family transcriptional regulator